MWDLAGYDGPPTIDGFLSCIMGDHALYMMGYKYLLLCDNSTQVQEDFRRLVSQRMLMQRTVIREIRVVSFLTSTAETAAALKELGGTLASMKAVADRVKNAQPDMTTISHNDGRTPIITVSPVKWTGVDEDFTSHAERKIEDWINCPREDTLMLFLTKESDMAGWLRKTTAGVLLAMLMSRPDECPELRIARQDITRSLATIEHCKVEEARLYRILSARTQELDDFYTGEGPQLKAAADEAVKVAAVEAKAAREKAEAAQKEVREKTGRLLTDEEMNTLVEVMSQARIAQLDAENQTLQQAIDATRAERLECEATTVAHADRLKCIKDEQEASKAALVEVTKRRGHKKKESAGRRNVAQALKGTLSQLPKNGKGGDAADV